MTTATLQRRSHASLVPPQHGAWAFLGLPLVLGALVAPRAWSTLLLVGAVFTCYPASYFALSLARARRGARFRRPLLVWSLVAAPPSLVLLVSHPWLVWVGIGYAALFSVNVRYARQNRERDLGNDVLLSVQAVAVVPLTWLLATDDAPGSVWVPALGGVPDRVWLLTAVCALVLVGSTLHVKSLLRERKDPRFAAASQRFAVLSLALAVALGWAWGLPGGPGLVLPFGVLAARASKRDWTGWRPARIGLVELGCFVIVAAGAAVAVLV